MRTLRLIGFSRPLDLVAADRLGFFEREGLKVEYTQTPDSVTQMRGLIAGDWNIAHTAADNVMAYVEGEAAGLVIVFVPDLGLTQKLFVVPGVHSYQDLRGQALGVDALDTGYAFVLRKMLQLNGLGADDYTLVSVGATPRRLAALRERRVAGALLSGPLEDAAAEEGFPLLEPAADYYPLYASGTVSVTRAWAASNASVLQGYLRGYLAGSAWARDETHRAEAIALLAEDQRTEQAVAARRYDRERREASRPATSESEVMQALQAVLDLRWEMAAYSGQKPTPARYYDPTYARQVSAFTRS